MWKMLQLILTTFRNHHLYQDIHQLHSNHLLHSHQDQVGFLKHSTACVRELSSLQHNSIISFEELTVEQTCFKRSIESNKRTV